MKDNKDIRTIESNYDNLGVLKVCKYLINVVINDIEYMNNLAIDKDYYNLGNENIIETEDLESLVSIIETIENVEKINNKELV